MYVLVLKELYINIYH